MAAKKKTKTKKNIKTKKSIAKRKTSKAIAKKLPPKKKTAKVAAKKPVNKKKAKVIARQTKAAETVFIVNPNAGAGKAKKVWPHLENLILKNIDNYRVLFTEGRRHATILARKAIIEGSRNIVAIGGDGTISEVAAGFFDEKTHKILKKPSPSSARLAIIAAGSGSDFIKTMSIPKDIENAIQILKQGNERIIDMGLVTFVNRQKEKETRPFINISDVGIGGEVIDILESQGKSKGGFISYQLASLKGLIRYKNKKMYITIDKKIKREGIFNAVVVANGKYFGSGMMVAPQADPSDGYFDVVLLGAMKKLQMIFQMPKLQKGTHIYEKGIEVVRAKNIVVKTDVDALLDLDGEGPGITPVEFQIVPQAISVVVP